MTPLPHPDDIAAVMAANRPRLMATAEIVKAAAAPILATKEPRK